MNPNIYSSYVPSSYYPQIPPAALPAPWMPPPPAIIGPPMISPVPIEYPSPAQLPRPVAYNPLNPYHNMHVYQTNNYYGSNFNCAVPPELPRSVNLESQVFKNNTRIYHGTHRNKVKNTNNARNMPQIINLDDSQQVQQLPVNQRSMLHTQKPKQKQKSIRLKNKKDKNISEQIVQLSHNSIPVDQVPTVYKKVFIDPMEQLQRNLKMGLPEQVRRSKRKRVSRLPKRYKQYIEEEIALPIDIKAKKLVFGFPLSQQQKVQFCMVKLRELKPQIMISNHHQVQVPQHISSSTSKSNKSLLHYLSKKRTNLLQRKLR